MKSYSRWLQCLAFAAVLCMISLAANAQTSSPAAPGTASRPSALDEVMKYAPQGAVGVIHVEVKALVKEVLAAFAKEPEFKGIEVFEANTVDAIAKLGEKIDSVELFLGPKTMLAGIPEFLIVVRGPVTPSDINQCIRAISKVDEDALTKDEGAKGHYQLVDVSMEYVQGGEATELPAGVSLAGLITGVSKEALAGLGKGKSEELAKLLSGVERAAPAWAAVSKGELDWGDDAPTTIAGCLYFLGGGKSRLEMVYKDANFAATSMKELQDANNDALFSPLLRCIGEPALDGAALRFVSKDTSAILPKLLSTLADARRDAKKTASRSYLQEIGGTITIYSADHDDKLPADLLEMVKAQAIPAQMLVSPVTGRKVNLDANGQPASAFEPDYVLVKYPMSMLKIKDRAKRVLVYERPENYKKEGTLVLYVDEHVEWVKMEEFSQQLKATQDWIEAQGTGATTKDK
jgi:hypothetical protein